MAWKKRKDFTPEMLDLLLDLNAAIGRSTLTEAQRERVIFECLINFKEANEVD